jgi:hypothetical protein
LTELKAISTFCLEKTPMATSSIPLSRSGDIG